MPSPAPGPRAGLARVQPVNVGKATRISADKRDVGCILDLPLRCDFPESFQIVIGVTQIGDAPVICEGSFAIVQLRAHLTWGLGLTTFDAYVDIDHGTQIALVAQNVELNAEMIVKTCGDRPECLPEFSISAGLGLGCTGRAHLTEHVILCGSDDCELVPVPPFARDVQVVTTDGEPVTLEFIPYGSCLSVGCGQVKCGDTLRVPGGMRMVRVTNASNRAPLVASLVFGLSI